MQEIARRLLVRAWHPPASGKDEEAARPAPVLVFNAAWGGGSDSHVGLLTALVRHGFIVVSVDHRLDLDEYGPFMDFSSDQAYRDSRVAIDEKARLFAGDNSAVLDMLISAAACSGEEATARLARLLDFTRVGILGYSFGGAVAAQTAWQDPRFGAAVNMDGWLFADAASGGLARPFMEISDDTPLPTKQDLGASKISDRLLAQFNDLDYRQLRNNMTRYGGYYLVIKNTRHGSFVDLASRSLARQAKTLLLENRAAPAIIQAYVRSFFDRYVAGVQTSLIDQVPSPYSDVRVEMARPPGSSAAPARVQGA